MATTPLAHEMLETVQILKVDLVGAYALNFTFSPDSHATGIYPYDLLRDMGDAASFS